METAGVEQLRSLVRGVFEDFTVRQPARFAYAEKRGVGPGATVHLLERTDLTRRFGIAVSVEQRLREHGEAVRRAIVDGTVDYSSSMVVFGESAADWKIRRWAEDLAESDGIDWR